MSRDQGLGDESAEAAEFTRDAREADTDMGAWFQSPTGAGYVHAYGLAFQRELENDLAEDFAAQLEDDLASPCPCGSGVSSLLCQCTGR